jgi:hypothetical protein
MAIFLTFLLIVAIIMGLLTLSRYRSKPSHAHKAVRNEAIPGTGSLASLREKKELFWGAELGQPGCTESHKLLGHQFSFGHAPDLPLAGCTREACTCQFKGLRERRVRARRTHSDRRSEVRYDKSHPDRRAPRCRRRGDLWANRAL